MNCNPRIGFKILIILFCIGFIEFNPEFAFSSEVSVDAVIKKYRRHVDFEWEPIPEAKSYDLELQKLDIKNAKPVGKLHLFKTKSSQWSGKLEPGPYQMRVRAKDWRAVPGDWSPPEVFKVGLEKVIALSPKVQERIIAPSGSEAVVRFQWQKVGAAEDYVISVTSKDEKFSKEKIVSRLDIDFELPVAQEYLWSVKARGAGLESETNTQQSFILMGAKIKTPQVLRPENQFVRELSWKAPEFADTYAYSLQRLNLQTKKWELVERASSYESNKFLMKSKWPGGQYKVSLRAEAPMRVSSDVAQLIFNVKSGDRSPAAEEIATVRQSIDRLTGWYGMASYLVTMMNFNGANNDLNSQAEFSGVGGTGRLGVGKFSAQSNWGFLGILDMSGILIDGLGNYTFASSEIGAVYRTQFREHGEFRQHVGGFYKELPELILDHETMKLKSASLVKFAGAHYGVEYWHALNSKLGLQANLHIYPNLIALATAGSKDLSSSSSYQFGFLGSYRLKKNMTGLLGYAYRQDEVKYQTSATAAIPNAVNSSRVQGHYLNLLLEWAL